MAQTYLKNGYVLSMDANDTVYDGGGVLVEDDKIVAVGKVDPALVKPDAAVIELNGKYVLPGFVNTHVHTSQQISRGVGDDVDFITWLHDRMWPCLLYTSWRGRTWWTSGPSPAGARPNRTGVSAWIH